MTKLLIVKTSDLDAIGKQDLLRTVLSTYLGEQCPWCRVTFDTLESLEDAVWAPWEGGRIAHKACFDEYKNKDGEG